MNKGAIKKFAVTARQKLMEAVAQKAFELGITKDKVKEAEIYQDGFMINQKYYKKYEIKQREKLIREINVKGYDQIMEEVAYTWFNRFIALRFMEVNDYLPTGVRVFSCIEEGKTDPDILTEVLMLVDELNLDEQKIYELQDANDDEDLFKYILIKQCNKLGDIMPIIFESIDDETELLLPTNLISESGVINDMITQLDELEWQEVEIIGWLYQFYNSEIKEQVGGLRNNSVAKEHLPVVTQLFTPKWIVQYMVENSLGKLYDQINPNNNLSSSWEYYLKSDSLKNTDLKSVSRIEDIKVIDPACGSGHILIYAFDLLYEIYKEAGYNKRDIPQMILENNIYGLDIDKRSTQIATIVLWMKALEKEPSFLQKGKRLRFQVIELLDADNTLSDESIEFFVKTADEKNEINLIQKVFKNGKQFGSLIVPPKVDYAKYIDRLIKYDQLENDLYNQSLILELKEKLLPVIKAGMYLHQKYDVVVTNPPYHNKFNPTLKKFMQKNYKDTKSDLYSAFIARTTEMAKNNGYAALMTPFTWMFISSHEKLRAFVLNQATISSLVQLEYSAFEEATVPLCTFVIQNQKSDATGEYIRLADFKGAALQPIKLKESVNNDKVPFRYKRQSTTFTDIPGSPIAYWASEQVISAFRDLPRLEEFFESGGRTKTHNNERFVRFFWEVSKSKNKWVTFSNGGEFRKYYGNEFYVVDWSSEAKNEYKQKGGLTNSKYWNTEGITWNMITSGFNGFKLKPKVSHYSSGAPTIMSNNSNISLYSTMAFLNSNIVKVLLKIINPTLNTSVGEVLKLPYISTINKDQLVVKNINISKSDWDSFETSWDFKTHPFIEFQHDKTKISEAYSNWEQEAEQRFQTLKANEEELNRIFIDLYGLQDELTPEVADKEVTVNRADQERDVKSFISYTVGLMLGRYSLDKDGLAFAGGQFNPDDYQSFKPDPDNVIPIAEDAYFEDDIVARFITIMKTIYGQDSLEANLDFIADSLTRKANETSRQRIRRYFLKEFYKDHVKTYQKRPIYWLFDSGKENGFKALVYLHRYDSGSVSRVRTEYLHAQQRKYEEEMNRMDMMQESDVSQQDKTKAKKEKEKLQKQLLECQQYDQVIAHVANQKLDLDLDDGVKVNYEKFQNVEVPQGEGRKALKANVLAKI